MGGNVAVLGEFLRSFLEDGPDAALVYVAPDVVADEPASMPYGGTYRGKDEFAELMRKMAATVEIRVAGFDLHESGDTVVARFDSTFVDRATGVDVVMPMVGLYSFTAGLISRTDMFYKDTKVWADRGGVVPEAAR